MSDELTEEKINEFETRLKSIKDDAGGKCASLGCANGFEALKLELAEHGLKACSSWACEHPIKPKTEFYKHAGKSDGLRSYCKPCTDGEGGRRRVEAAKRAKTAVTDAIAAEDDTTFSRIDVENVVSDWLIPEMEKRDVELPKTNEFRKADNGARLVGSTEDSWLQVQLKANGPYKEDGTAMPNNRLHPSNGGGRAQFSSCTGYDGMLLIMIKTRIAEAVAAAAAASADATIAVADTVDADGMTRVYTVWACDGADMTKEHPIEHVDGTLGPKRIAPITLDALADRIKTSSLPRVTWKHMFFDVPEKKHRKEIVLMLSMRATGATVSFPVGNQTAVDCLVDDLTVQAKTFTLANGSANAHHIKKGHPKRPYTAEDGIQRMLEGMIVKSDDRFYYLYAFQPLHDLLVNGIFGHKGYRGLPESNGNSTISIPLGIFQMWLKGEKRKNKVDKKCEWLQKAAFGFRRPIEIKPGDYGIPGAWLEEAAQEVANPAAFPSEAQLAKLDERIQQHELMIQAGVDSRAAKDAAKEATAAAGRVEAAADRAEAAAAAAASTAAGPSYITNNNITVNFNGEVSEPVAKRLCQSSIRGFLK